MNLLTVLFQYCYQSLITRVNVAAPPVFLLQIKLKLNSGYQPGKPSNQLPLSTLYHPSDGTDADRNITVTKAWLASPQLKYTSLVTPRRSQDYFHSCIHPLPHLSHPPVTSRIQMSSHGDSMLTMALCAALSAKYSSTSPCRSLDLWITFLQHVYLFSPSPTPFPGPGQSGVPLLPLTTTLPDFKLSHVILVCPSEVGSLKFVINSPPHPAVQAVKPT